MEYNDLEDIEDPEERVHFLFRCLRGYGLDAEEFFKFMAGARKVFPLEEGIQMHFPWPDKDGKLCFEGMGEHVPYGNIYLRAKIKDPIKNAGRYANELERVMGCRHDDIQIWLSRATQSADLLYRFSEHKNYAEIKIGPVAE